MHSHDKIIKALKFAKDMHKGQKYGNGDYFEEHCRKVYDLVREITNHEDINLMIAAILHDTLEDTETTYDDLQFEFGEDVADLVKEVTNPDILRKNYFPNLKTQRGFILKFADRTINLSRMENWDEERQQEYMNKSIFWESE